MLVRMLGHGGVQEAYTNTQIVPCYSCGGAILPGFRYTVHLFPDKRTINPLTNRFNMVYYALCSNCAQFSALEPSQQQPTSEIEPVRSTASHGPENEVLQPIDTGKIEVPIGEQETDMRIPIVRTNTPRPAPKLQPPRSLRHKVVLSPEVKEEKPWTL